MPTKDNKSVKEQVANEKLVAILSYLLIGIIWFFVDEKMKKSDYAKFHVKQGIVFIACAIVINIISNIIFFWASIIISVVSLAVFVLMIIGIINAASGKKKEIPILGGFAKYLKF